MKKIILTLICFVVLAGIAYASERISDNCYKFDGVLVCEAQKIPESNVIVKVKSSKVEPQKQEESPIIKTTWEYGDDETRVKPKKWVGFASYYTVKSSSNITASGERYDENAFTCAKWDVPFNTILKVTNIENSKFVLVRVTDRGPARRLNRVIDLTPRAFKELAPLSKGLIRVKIEVVK